MEKRPLSPHWYFLDKNREENNGGACDVIQALKIMVAFGGKCIERGFVVTHLI